MTSPRRVRLPKSVVPYVQCEDKVLIDACLQGKESAWEALLDRYGKLIYTIALRVGLSQADAEEVHQNVCIIVLNHLSELRDQATGFRSWLATITRREAVRFSCQSRRYVPVSTDGLEAMEEANGTHVLDTKATEPEEKLMALADQALVRHGLEMVSERCHTLITALYVTEPAISYADLGITLGLPVGSIGPTRARCLESLRKILLQLGF